MHPVLKLRFAHLALSNPDQLLYAACQPSSIEAQSAADAAKIAATLPADSRAVIDRLSTLRELPDAPWKMHAGDLAHGEAVDSRRERLAAHRAEEQRRPRMRSGFARAIRFRPR